MGERAGERRPRVSVVLAVYEQPRFLELALTSLARQTFGDFEVIVADDGSGPAVRAVVESFRTRLRQPVEHIWHRDDGFRKTVIANRAVEAARGTVVVFADGDCVLHRRFLERHHARSARRHVLSGRRVMLDAVLTRVLTTADVASGRLERPWFWWRRSLFGSRRRGLYLPWTYGLNRWRRRDYTLLGSNFSLFRDDFLAVNGYDERILGRGLEDSNLEARLRLAGCVVRNVSAEALQYHLLHEFAPFPHDLETWRTHLAPTEAWTAYGVRRGDHASRGLAASASSAGSTAR